MEREASVEGAFPLSRLGRIGKVGIITVALVVVSLMPASPAGAIIGGQPDGQGHAYVGAIDARPTGAPIFTSTGVLISPTVFLTPAHAAVRFARVGLTQARVTFDPIASDSSSWYTGTIHINPAYDPTNTPNTGDLAVIVFPTPVSGITPASLPTERLLDQIGPRGLSRATFNVVGYGVSRYLGGSNGGGRPRPDFASTGTRRIAQQTFASLTSAWLRLRMNEGAEICIGDSGSPSLLGSSDVIAGMTIGQASLSGGQCLSQPSDIRMDTPSARAFLGQYVTLP
jgi:hypothetical protein